MQSTLKFPKLLVSFFICALVLRAAILFLAIQHPNRTIQPDTQSYIRPALSLLKDHAYTYPSAIRTPIYPSFVALSYILFGQTAVGIVALQFLISMATVLLTYFLGIRLLSQNAAVIGSLLIGISVEAITHVFFLLTETLFTFLLLASILAFVEAWHSGRKFWLIISAILLAFAVLCRPIALFFPFILVGIFIFCQNVDLRQCLYSGFVYLLVFTLVLFPWVLRNKIVVGVPTVSTISSASMLYYNAAMLKAYLKNASPAKTRAELHEDVNRLLAQKGLADTEGNRYTEENILAQQIISQAPLEYIYLYLKSDLNNFLPSVTDLTEILGITQGGKGTADILNRQGLLAAINYYFGDALWLIWLLLPIIILLFLTYIMDVVGAVALFKDRQWLPFSILVLTSIYLLFIPGGASLPRFRVPAIPYISLLAGFGFDAARKFIYWKFIRL